MGLKELIKGVGKDVLVTAATVVSGVALGPLGAAAVGGFLSRVMGKVGVDVDPEDLSIEVANETGDEPAKVTKLTEPKTLQRLAEKLAEKTNQDKQEILAGLQYGFRELQGGMGVVMGELRGNTQLIAEVMKMAGETDAKTDQLITHAEKTERSMDEVIRRLDSMERGLDITFRKFIGDYSDPHMLSYDRLMMISRLQRQRTVVASSFGIRYEPSLYVPRHVEEGIFDRFIADAGMSDRNIFLVLGNVGLGKTWFMARMSNRAMELNQPTFFVPLGHGIKSLTSVFKVESIPALVDLIDPILDEAGEHAYIFLDGLDEMDPTQIRHIMGALSSARSDSVSFIISCRATDWASNRAIVRGANDIKYYIYDNPKAGELARSLRINTPVSVLMSEFTDKEMSIAMDRYGIPREVPEDLLPLLKRPYIMRLSAQWYYTVGSLPSPSSPEFLDLFAGGPEYTDSVFRRLGILTERDSLYATVEKIIQAKRESLPLNEIPIDPESSAFSTLVSSGMLIIKIDRIGTTISLSPEFLVPLFSLTVLRHQTDPTRIKDMLEEIKAWKPEAGHIVDRIVAEFILPKSPRPVERAPPRLDTQPRAPDKAGFTKGITQDFGRQTPAKPEDAPIGVATPPPITSGASLSPTFTAASEIKATNPMEVADILLGLLNDPDVHVRRAASIGLGLTAPRVKDEHARLELLLPLLDDPDSDVRAGAAWGLSLVASSLRDVHHGVELLQPLTEDLEWAVRRRASFGVGLFGARMDDESMGMSIIEKLLHHNDGQVRAGAAAGVGLGSMSKGNPSKIVDLLIPLLEDQYDDARGGAALGLGLIASALPPGSKAADPLFDTARKGFGRIRVGSVLGLSLASIKHGSGRGIVGAFSPLLNDSSFEVRGASCIGIGLAASSLFEPEEVDNAIEILIPKLNDDEESVRSAAALGLSYVASRLPRDKMTQLLETLLAQTDENIRACACVGYGMAATRFKKPTEKIDILSKLLGDREKAVRKGALLGIGLASTKVRDVLTKVNYLSGGIASEDPVIRKGAALALGISLSEVELDIGVILGESFWGTTPLTHEECMVAGAASSIMLRYGT
ncbi:MAG: hypothetical protein BAJATHORv1_60137 [Candidatus Thorarchaeota archaeon]|nr:MAG: hypothetical protein BAJATHORv1_60137 [Candidatus Thorarchaeota archaeon]